VTERDALRERVAALEREVARQKSLVEASQSLHTTLDLDALLRVILETASGAVGAERGTVYLLSDDGKELWSKVVAGDRHLEIRLPIGKGIAGSVAAKGETIRIDDAYADSRFDPSTDRRSGFRTRSILCSPIRSRDGRTVGVFQLLNKRGDGAARGTGEVGGNGAFGPDDVETLDALSVHAALAVENARLHRSALEKERQDREIAVAQGIQRALQPERGDRRAGRFALAGLNELCEDASGDYYDFFDLADGRVGVAIGDVSGHGLGSAMVMAEARAFLRAFSRTVSDLSEVVALMNEFLARDLTAGKFMTLFVGALDDRTGTFEWCSAGHNPPLLLRKATGEACGLDATGPVLGVMPGLPYRAGKTVTLDPGDLLVLYTDGATEAPDPSGELFGEERLEKVVREAAARPPTKVIDAIRKALAAWMGGRPNRDDLTLAVVKSD
jgi:serine phosphatase RsbU (regulator of sigma subunit)